MPLFDIGRQKIAWLFIVSTASLLILILVTRESNVKVNKLDGFSNDRGSDVKENAKAISQTIAKRENKETFTIKHPSTMQIEGNRVIIMTILRGRESWGKERSFKSYLEMVSTFDYPKELISFGLLLSDREEYDLIKEHIETTMESHHYASFKLILLKDDTPTIGRKERHRKQYQKQRRRTLAKLRNYLLFSSLEDNDSVLWIDADIISIPSDLLSQMILSKKDILAPQCQNPKKRYYDYNTWKGPRKKPTPSEQQLIQKGETFTPGPTNETTFLYEYSEDFVEIDSVGGTVLFMKADLHREGVVFPTQYIVGGDWEYEGYDAIETEGICYLAKYLGYKCWGMPNAIVVHDLS